MALAQQQVTARLDSLAAKLAKLEEEQGHRSANDERMQQLMLSKVAASEENANEELYEYIKQQVQALGE